jgi:hypothetical protein
MAYVLDEGSPKRPKAGFVVCVSPVFQPVWVAVVGNVRVILSHVLFSS